MPCAGHFEHGDDRLRAIAGDQGRIADAQRVNLAGRIDMGQFLVDRLEGTEGRHVLGTAIGKGRRHAQRIAFASPARLSGPATIVKRETSDAGSESSRAPAAIQLRRIRYSALPLAIRLPP